MPINLLRLKTAIDMGDDIEVQKIIEECRQKNQSLNVFFKYGDTRVSLLSYVIDICSDEEKVQNILLLLVTAVDARNRSMMDFDAEDDTLQSPLHRLVNNEFIPNDFKQLIIQLIQDKISQEAQQDEIENKIKSQLIQAIHRDEKDVVHARIADMLLNNISFDFHVGSLPFVSYLFACCKGDPLSEELIDTLLAISTVNINKRCGQKLLPVEHLLLSDEIPLDVKERIFHKMLAMVNHNKKPKLKVDIEVLRRAIACNYPVFVVGLLSLKNSDGTLMIPVNTVKNNRTVLDFALSLGAGLKPIIVDSLIAVGAKKGVQLNPANNVTRSYAASSSTSSSSAVSSTATIQRKLPEVPNDDMVKFYRVNASNPLVGPLVSTVRDGWESGNESKPLWLVLVQKLCQPMDAKKCRPSEADVAELDYMKLVILKFENVVRMMGCNKLAFEFICLLLKVVLGGLEVNDDELGKEDFQRLDILLNDYLSLSEKDLSSEQEAMLNGVFWDAVFAAQKEQLTSVQLFMFLQERFKYINNLLTEEARPALLCKL